MKWLVFGGAGFIGCNLAARLIGRQDQVVVVDNLSRLGSSKNLEWLQSLGPMEFHSVDIRQADAVRAVVKRHKDVGAIAHLAAQVAVTTSVTDPRNDFECNALGTFNVLEAVRSAGIHPVVVHSSTNKVYGNLEHLKVILRNGRYQFRDLVKGVAENSPLDFHSPYGCSKGTADQYVADYARIYDFRTINFRQSCIYGPRQFGVEDQGWVAWFTIAAILGKPITIYGDGRQVRDVLYVEDLIDGFLAAVRKAGRIRGRSFNMGGGPKNTMSLLELLRKLESLLGRKLHVGFSGWRPGDQKVFVCDISKARKELAWAPRTRVDQGLAKLAGWVQANRELLRGVLDSPPPSRS